MKLPLCNCRSALDANVRNAAFVTAFVLLLAVQQHQGVTTFPYDSGLYWGLSEIGSLMDFPKSIRGYLYPTLLAPVRWMADGIGDHGVYAFRVSSSLIYAWSLSCWMPEAFLSFFQGRLSFTRRLTLPVFVALLYPGLIAYPLSDLPACLLMVGSLSLMFRGVQERRVGLLIAAGILAGAGYNVRTIYVVGVAFIAVLTPWLLIRHGASFRAGLGGLCVLLFGFVAIGAPQAMINWKNGRVPSPFVIATVNGQSLISAQLQWGIAVQRYETSIEAQVPSPTQVYLDAAGERLFASEEVRKPLSVKGYLRLVFANPLEFAGIYGRHLVNGIDLRDGEVYITKPSADRSHLGASGFLLAVIGLLLFFCTKNTSVAWLAAAFMTLPVAFILPGAIETRFFLPLHLLAWGLIAVRLDSDALRAFVQGELMLKLFLLLAGFLLFISISTSTMASLTYAFPPKYM